MANVKSILNKKIVDFSNCDGEIAIMLEDGTQLKFVAEYDDIDGVEMRYSIHDGRYIKRKIETAINNQSKKIERAKNNLEKLKRLKGLIKEDGDSHS